MIRHSFRPWVLDFPSFFGFHGHVPMIDELLLYEDPFREPLLPPEQCRMLAQT